jgi:hypothetical protein
VLVFSSDARVENETQELSCAHPRALDDVGAAQSSLPRGNATDAQAFLWREAIAQREPLCSFPFGRSVSVRLSSCTRRPIPRCPPGRLSPANHSLFAAQTALFLCDYGISFLNRAEKSENSKDFPCCFWYWRQHEMCLAQKVIYCMDIAY